MLVPIQMTAKDWQSFQESNSCEFCQLNLMGNDSKKTQDYCHLMGKYRASLCNCCNFVFAKKKFYPQEISCFWSNSFEAEPNQMPFNIRQTHGQPNTQEITQEAPHISGFSECLFLSKTDRRTKETPMARHFSPSLRLLPKDIWKLVLSSTSLYVSFPFFFLFETEISGVQAEQQDLSGYFSKIALYFFDTSLSLSLSFLVSKLRIKICEENFQLEDTIGSFAFSLLWWHFLVLIAPARTHPNKEVQQKQKGFPESQNFSSGTNCLHTELNKKLSPSLSVCLIWPFSLFSLTITLMHTDQSSPKIKRSFSFPFSHSFPRSSVSLSVHLSVFFEHTLTHTHIYTDQNSTKMKLNISFFLSVVPFLNLVCLCVPYTCTLTKTHTKY